MLHSISIKIKIYSVYQLKYVSLLKYIKIKINNFFKFVLQILYVLSNLSL